MGWGSGEGLWRGRACYRGRVHQGNTRESLQVDGREDSERGTKIEHLCWWKKARFHFLHLFAHLFNKSFVLGTQWRSRPWAWMCLKVGDGQEECGARRWVVWRLGKGKVRAGTEPECLLCTIKRPSCDDPTEPFQNKDSVLLQF